MFALKIIKHLDLVENVLLSVFPGFVSFASDPFSLEKVEKAFREMVVVTVASAAQAMFEIVLL
jgi:hypothetical protein